MIHIDCPYNCAIELMCIVSCPVFHVHIGWVEEITGALFLMQPTLVVAQILLAGRWMCFSFSATMIKWHGCQISDEVSITTV
jgi:hypothetical protein